MSDIALNLFPVLTTDFSYTLYRHPYIEQYRPTVGTEQAIRRYLNIDGTSNHYWTTFTPSQNGTKTICKPYDNIYATQAALHTALINKCEHSLSPSEFHVLGTRFPRVEFVLAAYPEGEQVVSIDPYYLRSRRLFGFRAQFRFHPQEEHRYTPKALQLSLALDRNGHQNKNRYADRYTKLAEFIKEYESAIFHLELPGGCTVEVAPHLAKLPVKHLDIKHYIVSRHQEANSQFLGVKNHGPLDQAQKDTRFWFIYRPEDRPLAHDLFRALRGDTFRTFPGMEPMFHLSMHKDYVNGITISDFTQDEIERVSNKVASDTDNVIPIVLTPFDRDDDPAINGPYWMLKYAFLEKHLPLQVVSNNTIANRNTLKWSAASIGLQSFAKAGGTPWKVRPRTESCLIIGVGQAHKLINGKIVRYFAFSVLTDSSGVFEEVRLLGEGRNESQYIQDLSINLAEIIQDYSHRYTNFVVHSTFAIQHAELSSIADTLEDQQMQGHDGAFASLKFNEHNRFFGFAPEHNSRVPYESTLIRLSTNECLVWFEGLLYGQRTVKKMVGNPLHVRFLYPKEGLSDYQRLAYLQDAVNLSGANWRGFNAKSLPVSVYYAQIIAKYLKEFDNLGLAPIDVHTLKPWFL
ncbi:MAG: hypothetical protein F4X16_07515 [Caldilineaceae bacterium SB0661_bin_34]|nr:hypothetical protein [Caldilineaceae bacterium SB0661_bin_34]